MKKTVLYLLNVFLLVLVGYSILPDLSLNKKEFLKVSGLVSSVKKEAYDFPRDKPLLFNNLSRERLIIILADRKYHEYYVSDIYKEYWPQLLDNGTRGSKMVLYLGNGKQREDPFRIEVNDEVIYDTNIQFYRNLLIIAFTFALSFYNLFHYFKPDQKEFGLKSKRNKWDSIKNYFLNRSK